jgi:phenylalanine-4-hydroxylase
VAEHAFASPADQTVYEAAYTLSEVKENPASTPEQLAHAERLLREAVRGLGAPSEAARIARLYWWTAEYGLVGRVADYKLYGAGLLSSIGEAHFCQSPSVSKLPLTAECVEVSYDITRSQPQLFVVPSLAELEPVLETVAETLAHRRGGDEAVEAARRSADVATVELDTGAQVVGVVTRMERHEGELSLVLFSGQFAVAAGGAVVAGLPRPALGYALPLGVLENGTPLSRVDAETLARCLDGEGRFEFRLTSGIKIQGRLQRLVRAGNEIMVLVCEHFALEQHGGTLFRSAAPYPWVLGHRVRTAGAAVPAGFFPETAVSATTVPKPRTFDEAQRQRIDLHERAIAAWRSLAGSDLVREFEAIAARLEREYPDEWLLRWNLLESLVKLGERGGLAERIERDLERLEVRFQHLEPIASGLGYIRSIVAGGCGEQKPERWEAPR